MNRTVLGLVVSLVAIVVADWLILAPYLTDLPTDADGSWAGVTLSLFWSGIVLLGTASVGFVAFLRAALQGRAAKRGAASFVGSAA